MGIVKFLDTLHQQEWKIILEPPAGLTIHDAAVLVREIARVVLKHPVGLRFNEVVVTVSPEDTASEIVTRHFEEKQRHA